TYAWVCHELAFGLSVNEYRPRGEPSSDEIIAKVFCDPGGSCTSNKIDPGVLNDLLPVELGDLLPSFLLSVPEADEDINHLPVPRVEERTQLGGNNRNGRHRHEL